MLGVVIRAGLRLSRSWKDPDLPGCLSAAAAARFRCTQSSASAASPSSAPPGRLFEKILIANRGEIACRIIRTAKRLGIRTVAVFSEADRRSAHVLQADEAVCVGPASPLQSYLNQDAIFNAIETTSAQAVHPGYGFLSENAGFVQALDAKGITFIGPPAAAIAALGDKVESKRIAHQAGISTIPGWVGEVRDADHAAEVAAEIGYPVMIKASAGGGGKGMRFVWTESELRSQLPEAKAEAHSAFGSSALLIETFVEGARHIEMQVLGDRMGNVFYLPERDCSVQRRNQKVVEESPSPFVTKAMRAHMGEQAVALAKAVGYYSTGTVEFVVDQKHNFYFLEMNTRLQVEHPVTEAVTGLDLVEAMIRVAAGQPLELTQNQAATINGHAIESRVYAEDPSRNFLPSPGAIRHLVEPRGWGVRVDTGVSEGSEISMHYDPMISKLITWAPARKDALWGMASALDRYVVRGVANNLAFLRQVVEVQAFREGAYDTRFIPQNFPTAADLHPSAFPLKEKHRLQLLAAAAYLHVARQLALQPSLLSHGAEMELVLGLDHTEGWQGLEVTVTRARPDMGGKGPDGGVGTLEVEIVDRAVKQVAGQPLPHPHYPPGAWEHAQDQEAVSAYTPFLHKILIDGEALYFQVVDDGLRHMVLQHRGAHRKVTIDTPRSAELQQYMLQYDEADGAKLLKSPMTGTVVGVRVEVGQRLEGWEEVFVVEAMKMRNSVRVERGGTVAEVRVKEGQVVAADEVLVVLE